MFSSNPVESSVEQVGQQVESVGPDSYLLVKQRPTQMSRDLMYRKAVFYQDVVGHAHSVTLHGQPQRKGLGPDLSLNKIKVVKGVPCVNQCFSTPSVPNVPHAATEISVGGRLQSFWQVWQRLGSNPRVMSVLRDGYNNPFRERPQLSYFPSIVNKYASPLKNKALLKALASLIQKQAVEKVVVRSSLAFYNRLFLVPKSNRKRRPILDLSKLHLFLATNGDPKDHPIVSSKRGMGHVVGLQRCVIPLSHSPEVQKIPTVSHEQGQLPVHIPFLWFGNGPVGVYQSGQGGQADGSSKGYQDLPVPRRLFVENPMPGNLPTTYPDPLGTLPRVGLVSKHEEIGTDSSTGFQIRWLPVRPVDRSGLAHSGSVVYPEAKVKVHQGPELLHSQTVHVSDRSPHSDGETSLVRSPSHEAHPVALEVTLACSGGSGKGHSVTPFSSSSPRLVVEREQCTFGPAFASFATRSVNVYRRLKRRLGCSLRGRGQEAFGQTQKVAST